MSKIAKCPRCGEAPQRIQYKAGGWGYRCCGAEFFCATYWNQYAAAMELAKRFKRESDENRDHVNMSYTDEAFRVIEVFGGE